MTNQELKNKLSENGFSFNEELTRISFELENETEWGEHPENGDDIQSLLESILGEIPQYKMGDIYDESDYKYINWNLNE